MIFDRKSLVTLTLSAALLASTAAYAQSTPTTPSSAQPDRVQEQIQAPDFGTVEGPRIEVPTVLIEAAPEGADKVTFVLKDLQLQGVSAYDKAELQRIYANDLGKEINLTRLYAIAGEITRKYRNDGFIITQVVVPAQTIEGGQARLLVVEGALDRVYIEGDLSEKNSRTIRQYANRLTRESPLTASSLERYLLLINDLPGVKARSIISPSPEATGKADIRIVVSQDYAEFLLGVDNYGSRYLGPIQATAAAQFNNLLGWSDKLNLQAAAAPDDKEMQYGYIAYEVPVGPEGTTLGIDLSRSNTEPGYDVELFRFRGFSDMIGVTLDHPLIRSRTENLSASLRYDWRDTITKSDLEANTEDQIGSLRAGLRYDFLSTLLGTSVNTADLLFSKGVGGFGASGEGDLDLSRPDGDPEYMKAELELQRLQRVYGPFNVLVGARGQIASEALLSSEEFGLGGINYGRGYDPSEVVGDDGVAGKVELQWADPVKVPYMEDSQLFAFYDVGSVWNRDATTSEDKRNSLASTGLGARTNFAYGVSADATVAVPLTAQPQTEDDEGPRVYFSLTKKF